MIVEAAIGVWCVEDVGEVSNETECALNDSVLSTLGTLKEVT